MSTTESGGTKDDPWGSASRQSDPNRRTEHVPPSRRDTPAAVEPESLRTTQAPPLVPPSRQPTDAAFEPVAAEPESFRTTQAPPLVPPSRQPTDAAFEPVQGEPESLRTTHAPPDQGPRAPVAPVPLAAALGANPSDMRLSHHVGRFALLRRVGRGSMGLVFAAYDDILDRKVAIKLVPPHIAQSPRARKRMLREAQALAKLRHPNVVQVYDAGVEGDRLFIAMEFVSGVTLGAWATAGDEPRPWQEVLEVYMQAGRGLAAAHRAELVHRDFKPDNAMLGRDEIVRVMDFGLARTGVTPSEEHERAQRLEDADDAEASTMAGTPAYMAPEQWAKGTIDARTDQFSLCAALFEALWGTHPFEAPTLAMRAAAVIEGRIHEDLPSRGVPDRVRRVVLRGLATDPDDRWPTMDALLQALSAARRGPGRWWWGVAAIAVAATAAVAVWSQSDPPAPVPCQGLDSVVAEVWNPERKHAVYDALSGLEPEYAADTAQRTVDIVGRYSDALTKARRDACEAHELRQEQPEPVMRQRMACIEKRQGQLDAQLEQLEHADAQVLSRAVNIVLSLPTVTTCADLSYVGFTAPPPEDPRLRAEVDELSGELTRIGALIDAGKDQEADRRAEQALVRARATEHAPIVIDALNMRTQTLNGRGEHESELSLAQEAYVMSDLGARHSAVATLMSLAQAFHSLGRYDPALVELRRALLLQRQLSDRPTPREGMILNHLGIALNALGRHDEAVVELERARAIWLETSSSEETALATALGNIAVAHYSQGRIHEAISELEQVLDARLEALGPQHPRVASTYNNLAATLSKLQRFPEAIEFYRQAISIQSAANPESNNPSVARMHDNLGKVLVNVDRLEEALVELDRAHEIYARSSGTDPLNVVANLSHRAEVLLRLNRLPQALDDIRRAIELTTETVGPGHLELARFHDQRGATLRAAQDLEGALLEHQRTQSIHDAHELPPDHPARGKTHRLMGHVRMLQGQPELARDHFERALEIQRAVTTSDPFREIHIRSGLARALSALGEHDAALDHARQALEACDDGKYLDSARAAAQFSLAQVSWEIDAERPRARSLAQRALDYYARVGDRLHHAQVERWLADHRP